LGCRGICDKAPRALFHSHVLRKNVNRATRNNRSGLCCAETSAPGVVLPNYLSYHISYGIMSQSASMVYHICARLRIVARNIQLDVRSVAFVSSFIIMESTPARSSLGRSPYALCVLCDDCRDHGPTHSRHSQQHLRRLGC
jgi:hypothetical protein